MASFLDVAGQFIDYNTRMTIAENQRDRRWAGEDAAAQSAVNKRADEMALKMHELNLNQSQFDAGQKMKAFQTMYPTMGTIKAAEIRANADLNKNNKKANKPISYGDVTKFDTLIEDIIREDPGIGWKFNEDNTLDQGRADADMWGANRPLEQTRLFGKLHTLASQHVKHLGLEKKPLEARQAVRNLLSQINPVRADPADPGWGSWSDQNVGDANFPERDRAKFNYSGAVGTMIQNTRSAIFAETNAEKRNALKKKAYDQIMQSQLPAYLKQFAWNTITRGS